jgi:hypothetical protein
MGRWTVITELALLAEASRRGRPAEHDLLTLQRQLGEEGPEAFGLESSFLAGVPAWEGIEAVCRPDLFIELDSRRVWAELEIRPGRTIVLRRGRLE